MLYQSIRTLENLQQYNYHCLVLDRMVPTHFLIPPQITILLLVNERLSKFCVNSRQGINIEPAHEVPNNRLFTLKPASPFVTLHFASTLFTWEAARGRAYLTPTHRYLWTRPNLSKWMLLIWRRLLHIYNNSLSTKLVIHCNKFCVIYW